MAEITSAKAMARTVRVSPRKSRLVLDNIRGKSVADAIAILTFTPNKAAEIILKVLNSAVANAENNFGLDKANLVVSEAFANEGPTMKRFRPRAKGFTAPIRAQGPSFPVRKVHSDSGVLLSDGSSADPRVRAGRRARSRWNCGRSTMLRKHSRRVSLSSPSGQVPRRHTRMRSPVADQNSSAQRAGSSSMRRRRSAPTSPETSRRTETPQS